MEEPNWLKHLKLIGAVVAAARIMHNDFVERGANIDPQTEWEYDSFTKLGYALLDLGMHELYKK